MIRRVVHEGYRLPLRGNPPLRTSPDSIKLPKGKERREAVLKEIQSLIQKGVVQRVNPYSPGFYSHIFVVPKSSGGWRPVIDLKTLNKFVHCPHFKMHTVNSAFNVLNVGDWAFSVDLKDAYLHVPLHPNSCKYLRFAVEDKVLEFKALPFGLNTAPRLFTRLAHAVAAYLHQQGISIIPYLDDWLIHHHDRQVLLAQQRILLHTLDILGLMLNVEKSHLEPTQDIEFLGVRFLLDEGRVFLPDTKRNSLLDRVTSISLRSTVTYKQATSLLGSLNWMANWIPLGHLHLRPIQQYFKRIGLLKYGSPPKQVDQTLVNKLLHPWKDHNFLSQGVNMRRFRAEYTLYTDASTHGWGAHLGDHQVQGTWNHQECLLHINILELRAITRALQDLFSLVLGRQILVCSDNTTVVAYINHQGGTQSEPLLQEVSQLLLWCQTHNIQLRARHIPGRLNVIADKLSRSHQIISTEWQINPQVVQSLFHLWGTPSLDLFATRHNTQLQMFVSPIPDPQAVAVDALSIQWQGLWAYAFPPPALLTKVLTKAKEEQLEMILIAPLWPAQPWFPLLLQLISDVPRILPQRPDLLSQGENISAGEQFHLIGWRLSPPSSSMTEAFHKKLLNSSLHQTDHLLPNHMMADGRDGWIGQKLGTWIQAIPLSPK